MAKKATPKVVTPKVTSTLTPLQTLALSKCALELTDEQRKSVKPTEGSRVDMVVKIVGTIKVGEDNPSVIQANKVPWETMCLVALSKLNGVTVEAIAQEALARIKAAEEDDDANAELTPIKDEAKAVIDRLKGEVKGYRFGQVSFAGNVSLMEGDVFVSTDADGVLVKV